jgi:hypothetical protein
MEVVEGLGNRLNLKALKYEWPCLEKQQEYLRGWNGVEKQAKKTQTSPSRVCWSLSVCRIKKIIMALMSLQK